MPQSVDGMVRERCSEDEFAGVFDGFREGLNKFNNVCAVKCPGGDEVCNGEAVEH